jgi:transketolase C-terminal domain/subunit
MYIERENKCCINIITKPKANSAAEKIKKKKVKDNILTLSNIKPTNKTII